VCKAFFQFSLFVEMEIFFFNLFLAQICISTQKRKRTFWGGQNKNKKINRQKKNTV
jgi:hypothetical protein